MSNNTTINDSSNVTMHYRISLEDGTELETSFGDDALEFPMGQNLLTSGMELSLLGLQAGDKQTITLTAEQTYGLRDPDNIHLVSADNFPDDIDPETGQVIAFETPAGDDVNGVILDVTDEGINVDFNHPLSGNTLVFEVEILSVNNEK